VNLFRGESYADKSLPVELAPCQDGSRRPVNEIALCDPRLPKRRAHVDTMTLNNVRQFHSVHKADKVQELIEILPEYDAHPVPSQKLPHGGIAQERLRHPGSPRHPKGNAQRPSVDE
jgi:hypothetical protein